MAQQASVRAQRGEPGAGRDPVREEPLTVGALAARPRDEGSEPLFQRRFFLLALLAVSLFYAWGRMEVVKATYDLAQLQGALIQEEDTQQKLRLEILTLSSPERLERVAVQRLGMLPAEDGRIVVVPEPVMGADGQESPEARLAKGDRLR